MLGFAALAQLPFAALPEAIQAVVHSMGGLPPKKVKTHFKKDEHDSIAEIVKREFDKLDGTYVSEAVEAVKEVFIPKINKVDLNEYDKAIKEVNALLLQAKIQIAEYQAEMDDEEALLMLL